MPISLVGFPKPFSPTARICPIVLGFFQIEVLDKDWSSLKRCRTAHRFGGPYNRWISSPFNHKYGNDPYTNLYKEES